jgi:hypothetical protein
MFINSHAIHPSYDIFYTPSRHNCQFIYLKSEDVRVFHCGDNDILYVSPDIVVCIKKAMLYLMKERGDNDTWGVLFEDQLKIPENVPTPEPGWRVIRYDGLPRQYNYQDTMMMSLCLLPEDRLEYRLFYNPIRIIRDRMRRDIYLLFKTHYRTFQGTTGVNYTQDQIAATRMTAALALESIFLKHLATNNTPYEYLLCRPIT